MWHFLDNPGDLVGWDCIAAPLVAGWWTLVFLVILSLGLCYLSARREGRHSLGVLGNWGWPMAAAVGALLGSMCAAGYDMGGPQR